MTWVVVGALLIALSGGPGLFFSRDHRGGEYLFYLLALAGVGAGLTGIAGQLFGWGTTALELPWAIPGGALSLRLDPLTTVFLLPLFLVVACGVLYGIGYWPQTQHPGNGGKFRLFYGLISGAMIVVLTARNGMLFLMAWEVMALAGFFLITTEEEKPEVRRAGFIYLVATHTGTLALFALFALLGQQTGSFAFPVAQVLASGGAGTAIFLLGIFGFGLKAGLIPLHIWLPGAHAAAPSHASALLSGVMIKLGIYGLVRLTSFYADIPPWWGWTVLLLGVLSGIFGVALAIAQHDIKRLLAYHSVENIGIIAMGLGLALLGRSFNLPALTLLGIAGALLHVINHGLFKSLLFLSAGSVIHAVGTRDIDAFGGLLRRQPWTALFFLVGAVAICGLPPFNGFISEWLIYLGSFEALKQARLSVTPAVLVVPALALIGALALACFVKVFGITFLGEARSETARNAHEVPLSMRAAMWPLLAGCTWIGLLPGTVAPLLQQAALIWSPALFDTELAAPMAPLSAVGLLGWGLLLTLAAIGFWLWRQTRKLATTTTTWGCGYACPTPRMQYSASSFADWLVGLFHFGLQSEKHGSEVTGLFPAPTHFHSHTPDVILDRFLIPAFQRSGKVFTWLRACIQNGLTTSYLFYVALALIVLLSMTSAG